MRRALGVLIIVSALVFSILPAGINAQGGDGQIEGIVRDEQAAVLPGVTVTLRNQDSGVTRTTTTDSDGHYRFPALLPGTYSVKAELQGFAPQAAQNVTI